MIVKGYFIFFGDKAIHISKKIRIFAENFSADRKQRHFITPCRDWLYRSVFRNRTSLLAYCHREVRMPKPKGGGCGTGTCIQDRKADEYIREKKYKQHGESI